MFHQSVHPEPWGVISLNITSPMLFMSTLISMITAGEDPFHSGHVSQLAIQKSGSDLRKMG